MVGHSDPSQSQWGKMPHDVLARIFMVLDMFDLLKSVTGVCRSWRNAVYDPILWRIVDFIKFTLRPEICHQLPYLSDQCNKEKFMQLLVTIANYSNGIATNCLYFNYSIFLDKEHFAFATDRFPNVKHLLLPGWYRQDEPEFLRSIARCEKLESITLCCIYNPLEVMKCLSAHCLNLSKMKIIYTFDLKSAEAILCYLPNLKVLSLRSSMISMEALIHLVNTGSVLNSLNISHCLILKAKIPIEWEDAITSLEPTMIAKLRRFKWCNRRTCTRCLRMFTENDGRNQLAELKKDVRCEDEFTEFSL